jgi:hypothetical protein
MALSTNELLSDAVMRFYVTQGGLSNILALAHRGFLAGHTENFPQSAQAFGLSSLEMHMN